MRWKFDGLSFQVPNENIGFWADLGETSEWADKRQCFAASQKYPEFLRLAQPNLGGFQGVVVCSFLNL